MALLAVAPPASAAPSALDVTLTGTPNTGALAGTLLLGTGAAGGDVTLPAGSHVTWAHPTPLVVGSSVHDNAVPFDLYFTGTQGTVTVEYGSYNASKTPHYTPFTGSHTFTLGTAERNVPVTILPPPQCTPAPRPVCVQPPATTISELLSIGHVNGQLTGVSGVFAKGESPSIRLTFLGPAGNVPANSNTLYTQASALGSPSSSTATVPLPELPATLLVALGTVCVLGVAWVRRS